MKVKTISLVLFMVSIVAAACNEPILAPWTTLSTVKVRPFEQPADLDLVAPHIYSARNEWEAIQVVVRKAGTGALTGCDVVVSPLQGPGDDIDSINLYRETYVEIILPSRKPWEAGTIGYWPDGMIPFTDIHFGEDRDGAPFDVADGWNQPIWIDFYVEADQLPGDYAGEIEVSCDDLAPVTIPLILTVWDFALPETITLPSNYGYSCGTAYSKHQSMGGVTGRNELTQMYYVEALRHRMMLSSGHCAGPSWNWDPNTETGSFDMTAFVEQVGHAFDGTIYRPGVSIDTYRMPYPPGGASHTEQVAFWQELAGEFKARGWFDKMYLYLPDEPMPGEYPHLVELAATLHEADPDLKAMATEQIAQGLVGSVDIWCPDEPLFSDWIPLPPFPEDYPVRQAFGEKVWWYNCMSAQFVLDFSNHFVDVQGMYMRIWPWLTRRYNFEGLLFWHSVYLYAHNADPWTDQYATAFFCNGDGNMFYPGVPDKIGGVNDIPTPSLRLKLFREGMEDYEYFAILDALGHADFVQTETTCMARRTFDWEHDPFEMEASRHRIAEMILNKSGRWK
ncbi:glycoside hydrolase domain-containing protein [Thermodesulfobacteriota bacterium]